jgi:hypothetical protein
VRRALSIVLMLLGGLSALLSMFGVWFHLEIGPRHGPGLEVAVAALAASAVCFCAAYWHSN